MTTVLLVALGGAVGAAGRVGAELLLQRGRGFPWGTLVVNVVGAFVLGLTIGLVRADRIGPLWVTLVGTGFCGALTTFSGLAARLEVDLRERRVVPAFAFAAATLLLGLPAAAAGLAFAA
jgi:CrcB protein